MAQISGSYRHGTRPNVAFEAEQQDECWNVTVRSGTQRYEASTWAPSPWPTIERLVADALDGANRETEPGRYDMNRKLAKPLTPTTSLRRRGKIQPTDLPTWTPPTD